ncbi:prephenate dehydratase [Pelagirhabdus alkalitolerans]|uniref:Prephenate dehydratase n=1 Tax=Pelagirhabdus alkalitolerans TaxID=1612202 RepID=A0A1G6HPT4_9BACI|nr:prephenate dehydratase [Pelagirhabdus alkalitolerans]SDB96250.1 prephenate dehydratase [Pelagirhabdus alkalitolerans]
MNYSVGYLGPKGTFTQKAVDALFPDEQVKSYQTIPLCMDAVKFGHVKYGVVPIENTLEGTVNMTLDYLIASKTLKVVSEIVVPVEQHFMVDPNNRDRWKETDTIYSHPHALAQCHTFLSNEMKNVSVEPFTSTAAAAKHVSDYPERSIGAIANDLAAKEYGLEIIRRNVEDVTNNHTRFVVIHKNDTALRVKSMPIQGFKTTFMIALPTDHAGALHQVLSAFAWRRINLSKIESRPMKTGLGHYYFLIDVQQKMDDILIPNTVAEIEAIGCQVEILGSYPQYSLDALTEQDLDS